MDDDRLLYAPVNTLKPVDDDVWIVDGPAIRYGPPWPKMRFPTRMTVLRLEHDDLFVHSPTELTPELQQAIARLGTPRWIVAPSRIHYWWVPDWHRAYGQAAVYVAPRVREQAAGRIDFPTQPLDGPAGYPWDAEVATLPIAGSYLTEVEFFHYRSHTLILTDLIENFEPARLDSAFTRWLTRLGATQDPDGQMPRDMRLTFARQRNALRAAVHQMIAWDPYRIILAHGRWYTDNGTAELRRAFRWLLA
ncbi:DUF4336 domain-containing protein [Bordetella sp. BOR01]|uniref:DUF4336 domain-containing protein n=1 Tax=Bordetella sp. BOR01 TaxID=2854779 RepID=UPI001C461834|nr:DUF4336 domain-containing protein [Bordetella sp. BOR01]MBV7486799.1 DUF4336 domain-containing protein [Bordetella sp. BOR01]